MSLRIELTETDVLEAVATDEALTVSEIADRVADRHELNAWTERTNVRNRLYALEARGQIISDEGRPMRFVRNELAS